jgi:hypothetical protein
MVSTVSERNPPSYIEYVQVSIQDLSLFHTWTRYIQRPDSTTTNLNHPTAMDRFRADVIVLHVPTGELKRYREDFDTLEAAISRPFWFLRQLHDDLVVQLESDSWKNLNGQPRDDGVEEVFGCYFRAREGDEVHGMVLVTVLPHSDGDGTEPAI